MCFRNIGPAFVLTDDVAGLGTRRELLHLWIEKVVQERREALGPAVRRLGSLSARLKSLRDAPDSDPLSAEEMQFRQKASPTNFNPTITLRIPLSAMPQSQQDNARRMYDAMKADQDKVYGDPYFQSHPELLAQNPRFSLDGDLEVDSSPTLLLDVPGLDAPVNVNEYFGIRELVGDMVGSGGGSFSLVSSPPPTTTPATAAVVAGGLLARFPRRACLAAVQSIPEVDSLIDAMPAAGLNELWLVAAVPGSVPLKTRTASAGAQVAEAVARGRGCGISIVPVMSLLEWGPDAPAEDADRTLLGQTSSDLSRSRSNVPLPAGDKGLDLLVSPFSPDVLHVLESQEREVAVPGAAGIAWLHVTAPGYDDSRPGSLGDPVSDGGYQRDARLRFLRQFHVDPVDIPIDTYFHYPVEEPPPFFRDPVINRQLSGTWRTFLAAGNVRLLQSLAAALGPIIPKNGGTIPARLTRMPTLLEAPGDIPAYIEWDDPRRIPRLYHGPGIGDPRVYQAMNDVQRSQYLQRRALETEAQAVAVSGTRQALIPVDSYVLHGTTLLSDALRRATAQGVWSGFVIDLRPTSASAKSPARTSSENLRRLIEALHPAAQ